MYHPDLAPMISEKYILVMLNELNHAQSVHTQFNDG